MSIELEPLINGTEYGWSSISCNIGGSPVTGIRGIKYNEDQEKENVFGAGNRPVSRAYGRIKAEASITLLGSTVMALKAAAPKGQLYKIAPFTIVVSYMPIDGKIQTHHLKNCEFKNTGFDWKEGDTHKEIEFELIISHIVDKTNN